uniref:Uncharacterized protein n=1 Tax=Setaria italica TaxID=4555 RepID=K3Y0N2_SETIT
MDKISQSVMVDATTGGGGITLARMTMIMALPGNAIPRCCFRLVARAHKWLGRSHITGGEHKGDDVVKL